VYLFYIDESGNREYGEGTTRYFVLCGMGIPDNEWRLLNSEMVSLKKTYFRETDVEIKSEWLRDPRKRQKRYLDTFKITADELHECVQKVYDLIVSRNVTIFGAVIDKVQMQETYIVPQSPSSLAYKLLFERLELFLRSLPENQFGIVVFDKITQYQAKMVGYENLLTRQHLKYQLKGTDFVGIERIIEGLLFIPSVESNFLQIADLCAYNIFRQFRTYGEDWESSKTNVLRTYEYFERILPKIYKSPDGQLSGWGIKKYPDKGKILWGVKK
jgi:hypothetical protein